MVVVPILNKYYKTCLCKLTYVVGWVVWMRKGRDFLLKTLLTCRSRQISNLAPLSRMEHSSESHRFSFNPSLQWNPLVHDYFLRAYGPHHFSLISKALTYSLYFTMHYSFLFHFCLKSSVFDTCPRAFFVFQDTPFSIFSWSCWYALHWCCYVILELFFYWPKRDCVNKVLLNIRPLSIIWLN